MNPSEILKLKNLYWNTKNKQLLQEAKEAKAVMFGENIGTLFQTYRISESSAEIERRIQLAKPANQGDFESTISYISNYFDLDTLFITSSEKVAEWIYKQELESFFTDTVLPSMIASPNSFLTFIPKVVGVELDADIAVIDFEQVIYEDSNTLIFYESLEDRSNIIKLELDKVSGYTFKGDLINEFQYPLSVAKYWFKLGGLKKLNHRGYYSSYFKGAIDKSIIATRIFSDKELVRMRVGNPITIMKKLPCPVCNGDDKDCGTCHGTGTVSLTPSIGSVYYFGEYDLPGGGKTNTSLDDIIKYIQPPLDSVEVQQKQYSLHIDEVKQSLNSFFYKHAQSGVAKELDRENKVASTEVILFRLVELLENILNSYSQLVTVDKLPVSVTTPSELVVDTFNPINVKGQSAAYVLDKVISFYKTKYKNDAVMQKLFMYAILNDPLFSYAPEEKASVTNDEVVIGYSNALPYTLFKIKEKYGDRVRTATEATIKKWIDEFMPNR